jgi:hypothetical protein
VYLNSPQEIIAYVANNVSALGLVSLAEVRGERRIKALQVDAVGARLDHYRRGTWRLGCTFRAVTHPAPTSQDAKAWLAYLQGPTARGLLRRYMTLE